MSVHLITGYAGKEHITSADHGSFNAAVMGDGEFVLEGGEQFRCQVISNNKVRIFDGEALMQGRHIKVERNTYEETTHDNGTQGYKRIDLIVLTYTKNATTGIETASLDVIKGTPAESNPVVPSYVTGDILNLGELKNQMPLYQIPFDGLSIGEPVALFETVETAETMKKKVEEELEAKFEALSEELAEQVADAGKPLSSDADEWTMIEKYGEYSADAKTVGEEFAKVNNSLAKFKTYDVVFESVGTSAVTKNIDYSDLNISELISIIPISYGGQNALIMGIVTADNSTATICARTTSGSVTDRTIKVYLTYK